VDMMYTINTEGITHNSCPNQTQWTWCIL